MDLYKSMQRICGWDARIVDELDLYELGGYLHDDTPEEETEAANEKSKKILDDRIAWLEAGAKPEEMPSPEQYEDPNLSTIRAMIQRG